MRFVQFSDIHLDSYTSGALRLGTQRSAALLRDLRTAFTRACELAVARKANLVLIPGDLFDFETATADTAAFIIETLRGIAPIPAFITPGNHDSLKPGNPYTTTERGLEWPANVRVFTSPEFETVVLEELDCTVTGIAHAHRGITDRLISSSIPHPERGTNILLFHGSRDGYKPSEKETVIPFSDSELIAQRFTYAAIGHYHSYSTIMDTNGRVMGAYSGCPQGRGLDETGAKCVLVGEIDGEGRVALESVEVAPRRIARLDVVVTGCASSEMIFAKVDSAASAQARECDAVYVALKGTVPAGMEIDTSAWETNQPYFAAVMNASGVEPDYDLDAIARESAASGLRSAFVRKMLERQEQAADENERMAVRDAMYYGLYALDGKRLEPRDAD